jgi:drug/metabolite transporter (DMT)-like permease
VGGGEAGIVSTLIADLRFVIAAVTFLTALLVWVFRTPPVPNWKIRAWFHVALSLVMIRGWFLEVHGRHHDWIAVAVLVNFLLASVALAMRVDRAVQRVEVARRHHQRDASRDSVRDTARDTVRDRIRDQAHDDAEDAQP